MKRKHVLIIAEAGINHNGKLERALKMVEVAKNCGADIIKFQTAIPELLVTKFADAAHYQKKNLKKKITQLNMIKKYSLPLNDFKIIKSKCDSLGIEFLTTAFDKVSFDFVKSLKQKRYKIPSGEITNISYLRSISKLNKKVILSTGMSNESEINKAINILIKNGLKVKNITLMQCTSAYPTPMDEINLNVIKKFKKIYDTEVGLSDHSMGIEVPIAAVSLGSSIIEKHFTLNRNLKGPDHPASLEPSELKDMVTSIRNIELALGSEIKKPSIV